MKSWKPIFVENSRIPAILTYIAPITINAIALFPFVFARSKMFESTKRHETIHFQQQLETGVLGFYLVYIWDYIRNRIKGFSGKEAYLNTRAEKEAHAKQSDVDYLVKRKRWRWLKED